MSFIDYDCRLHNRYLLEGVAPLVSWLWLWFRSDLNLFDSFVSLNSLDLSRNHKSSSGRDLLSLQLIDTWLLPCFRWPLRPITLHSTLIAGVNFSFILWNVLSLFLGLFPHVACRLSYYCRPLLHVLKSVHGDVLLLYSFHVAEILSFSRINSFFNIDFAFYLLKLFFLVAYAIF